MERIVYFTEEADDDLLYFKKTGQSQILKKIRELIEDIKQNPTTGLGKPEKLKHNFTGLWSRRITKEHRLIYEIEDNQTITILSIKGHYD